MILIVMKNHICNIICNNNNNNSSNNNFKCKNNQNTDKRFMISYGLFNISKILTFQLKDLVI